MLVRALNIDIDKIKRRNEELLKMNLLDKLTTKEGKYLGFRKAPCYKLNKDGLYGYTDMSNYLINRDKFFEISLKDVIKYVSIYDIDLQFQLPLTEQIETELARAVKKINANRIKMIEKYIKIEDGIFKKGISGIHDKIYRVQNDLLKDGIIKNSTSWSLFPLDMFCYSATCHLYITHIPKKMKVLYVETNSNKKSLDVLKLFPFYEYEFILPRNTQFVEIKTKTIHIPNAMFSSKKGPNQAITNITCHWIKLFNKSKRNNDNKTDLPNNFPIKLVIDV